MNAPRLKQLPISVETPSKRDVRSQFGALCYRVLDGKTEILMITSRRTKRWIVPKGWPMTGLTPLECAMQEAWEEAGVRGKGFDQSLGLFSYYKVLDEKHGLPCVVMVYPVRVKSLADDFPEVDQRKRKWMNPKKAAKLVAEPELARLLRDFDPKVVEP